MTIEEMYNYVRLHDENIPPKLFLLLFNQVQNDIAIKTNCIKETANMGNGVIAGQIEYELPDALLKVNRVDFLGENLPMIHTSLINVPQPVEVIPWVNPDSDDIGDDDGAAA